MTNRGRHGSRPLKQGLGQGGRGKLASAYKHGECEAECPGLTAPCAQCFFSTVDARFRTSPQQIATQAYACNIHAWSQSPAHLVRLSARDTGCGSRTEDQAVRKVVCAELGAALSLRVPPRLAEDVMRSDNFVELPRNERSPGDAQYACCGRSHGRPPIDSDKSIRQL